MTSFDPTTLDPALWWYDEASANEAVKFIEKYLRHWVAQHEGKPFALLPWQRDVLRQFYGVKRVVGGERTHHDRYRTLYIESGKGTGKTPLACAIGLYHLRVRKEARPYVVNMAATHQQANELFDAAKVHVEKTPALQPGCVVKQYEITYPSRGARWRIMASGNKGKSGGAVSLYIIDELHEFDATKDQALSVIEGNLAKRENSKLVIITNAGSDLLTPCGKWHERALRIMRGEKREDDVLALVLAADPADDISKPETWKKANPSIGTTVSEDEYRRAYARTIGDKGAEISFRRLWLTQWTRSDRQWLKPEDVQACLLVDEQGQYVKRLPDAVKLLPHFVGFDLGPVDDITAAVQVYADVEADTLYVDCNLWLPRAAADDMQKLHGVPYETWHAEKYINIINGKALARDHKLQIAADMLASCKPPEVCAADASYAADVVTALSNGGWLVEAMGSSPYALNAATRDLEARIVSGRIKFVYNPCYVWQLNNCGLEINSQEKAKPFRLGGNDTSNPRKMDAVMATLYAMARAYLYMGQHDARVDTPPELDLSQWGGALPYV